MASKTVVWHLITEKPPAEGRYLLRAPTNIPNLEFFQVGYWAKMSQEELKQAPPEYRHGFYVHPEQWIPFLTHWAFIPPFAEPKKRSKNAVAVRKLSKRVA